MPRPVRVCVIPYSGDISFFAVSKMEVRISVDGGLNFVQAAVDSAAWRWCHTFQSKDTEYPDDDLVCEVISTVTDRAGKTVESRTLL